MDSTTTSDINIDYPEAEDLRLLIGVGACHLTLSPGESERWVTGTYGARSGAQPPSIVREGGTVRIGQERGPLAFLDLLGSTARLSLALGKARPFSLNLRVGASEIKADLRGVPISRLVAELGAGKADFDFSAPNPQAMSLLEVKAGAISMQMRNLANANFAEMSLDVGAASYELDFGGTLQRDAHVKISAGASSVRVRVPSSTAAKIAPESVLGSVDVGDGFARKEGVWWTEAALTGGKPILTIHATLSLGSLLLRTA